MSSPSTEPAEINGVHYEQAGDRWQRVLVPGEKVPSDVDVTVPHPDAELRKEGYRLAWIFLGLIGLCLCPTVIAVAMIPKPV
jgi:hypothetical protein